MTGQSSARTVAAIVAAVGEPVRAAWPFSTFRDFAVDRPGTAELHQHGWFDVMRKEWGWDGPLQTVHNADCAVLWPGYRDARAEALRS